MDKIFVIRTLCNTKNSNGELLSYEGLSPVDAQETVMYKYNGNLACRSIAGTRIQTPHKYINDI